MERHEVYVSARPFAFRFVAEYSTERTAHPSLLSSLGGWNHHRQPGAREGGFESFVGFERSEGRGRGGGAEATGRGKQHLRRRLRGDVHNSAVMPWVREDVHTPADSIKSKVSQCYYYLLNSRGGTRVGDEFYSTFDFGDNLTPLPRLKLPPPSSGQAEASFHQAQTRCIN